MDPMDCEAGLSHREDDQGPTQAKRRKVKRFLDSWMLMPEFAGWLQAAQDDSDRAFCACCQKHLQCGKSELQKHALTKKHIRKASLAAAADVLPIAEQMNEEHAHKAAIKSAKIQLSAFFAEHNIDIQAVDHLTSLLKDSFHDSRIAQDVALGRSTCTQIITNFLGRRELEKFVEILKVQKFSVLVYESTDISDTKSLCVLVQFVAPVTRKVVTELLELINLDAKNCSAENVYAAFKSCFESKGIPITNIVGAASDNASVMTGTHNSFMTRLKSDAPGLVVLNCICHSSVLIASKACAHFPRSCEDLIRSVATYVSGSAKCSEVLREFQELLNVETNKILKLSDTRWLSMHKCIVRLLDNWDVLKMYFAFAINEDKLKSAETILAHLENQIVQAYLLFLKYALNFFNTFTALYQSRKVLIHQLTEHSRRLITQFGQNFLKREVLNELASGTLNVLHPRNFIALDEIILGPECETLVKKIPQIHANEIRQTCLRFYTTAVSEMACRFPLKNSVLDELRFLDPSIALSVEGRGGVKYLSSIAQRFGSFDLTKLAFEWNSLPFNFSEEKKRVSSLLKSMRFGGRLRKPKTYWRKRCFPLWNSW